MNGIGHNSVYRNVVRMKMLYNKFIFYEHNRISLSLYKRNIFKDYI